MIVDSLTHRIDKSGTFFAVYNKKTKESAVYNWSTNVRLGKKFVLGSGFEVGVKAKNDHVCPMFDHYCMGFSGCDKFNRALHGKSWPYKLQGDRRVASDYLLTSVLINVYHLWIDAAPANENRRNISWRNFCSDLALEMVK